MLIYLNLKLLTYKVGNNNSIFGEFLWVFDVMYVKQHSIWM